MNAFNTIGINGNNLFFRNYNNWEINAIIVNIHCRKKIQYTSFSHFKSVDLFHSIPLDQKDCITHGTVARDMDEFLKEDMYFRLLLCMHYYKYNG